MTVTQSEGNMVNMLNDGNPTQLLLSAIKLSGLDTYVSGSFKQEEQFSLGALSTDGKVCSPTLPKINPNSEGVS